MMVHLDVMEILGQMVRLEDQEKEVLMVLMDVMVLQENGDPLAFLDSMVLMVSNKY